MDTNNTLGNNIIHLYNEEYKRWSQQVESFIKKVMQLFVDSELEEKIMDEILTIIMDTSCLVVKEEEFVDLLI